MSANKPAPRRITNPTVLTNPNTHQPSPFTINPCHLFLVFGLEIHDQVEGLADAAYGL